MTAAGITLSHTLATEISDDFTGGEFIVGLGTLLLATITVYVGWQARKTAGAAEDAVQATEVPFVIASATDEHKHMTLRPHETSLAGKLPPFAIHRAEERTPFGTVGYFVRLKLWNIGLGPAIVEQIHLQRAGVDFLDRLDRFYTLGVGHSADIEVPSSRWQEPCAALLTIMYRHASGREYLTTSDVLIDGGIVTCSTYRRRQAKDPPGVSAPYFPAREVGAANPLHAPPPIMLRRLEVGDGSFAHQRAGR